MNPIFTSKFIQLVQTFSKEEFKSFESWLNSPWCNTNKNLLRLLEKLKKYYPNFTDEKLTKEKLFKQVLPKGKYSDGRMNNLLSEAYLAAERFVIFQKLSADQNLQRDLLSQSLQSRHLEDWFFKDIQKEISRLEEKPTKEWEDHLELFQLHRRMYHHPNSTPRGYSGKPTILKMDEHLDLVYLLEKATLITEKIIRNKVYKNENNEVAEEVKKWKIACAGVKHPAIEFYQMRFNYTEKNMVEQYYELRELFFNRYEELSKKEQKVHLMSLLNDTSKLIKGSIIDITESLPLYKLGLRTGSLFTNGKLTFTTYAAMIAVSNTKQDFEFSKKIIEKYTKNLDVQFQEDAYNWAKAHTAYWERNLDDALKFLLEHDFKLPYFKLITKILTTQVYFEIYLKDESFQSLLFNYFDSFEKWILREKFQSEFVKKGFLRFIQLSRILSRFYSNVNFNEEKIEKLFEDETNIQAINWLNQKKEEIIRLKKKRLPKI